MNGEWLDRLLAGELSGRARDHQLRTRQPVERVDPVHVRIDGRRYVNFASNDYLGLTHHPHVLAAAETALRRHGLGSGASGLVSGYTPEHAAAERALAEWKGASAAVLLPSGYQAAHAAVQTIAVAHSLHPGGVRFLVDKLAHASLIDAIVNSGRPFRVFPHNHLEKLERLLRDGPADQMQVVVTESIFSMDGDAADLRGLAALKRRHPFILLLDEAHGSGVYGAGGAGYAAEAGLGDQVDVGIVTLSKAAGVVGGAVCASRTFAEALVNFGRAYIYSTSVPAMVAAAAHAAIDVMRREPHRQRRVRSLAARLRRELTNDSVAVAEGDSPIVPIILGHEAAALEAAARLREAGLLVVAIRPPTVPRDGSRLRVTLSCEHSDDEVGQLIEALRPRHRG